MSSRMVYVLIHVYTSVVQTVNFLIDCKQQLKNYAVQGVVT